VRRGNGSWRHDSTTGHLLKHKALSSNPSITKREGKKREWERHREEQRVTQKDKEIQRQRKAMG
jgi:hypothetical protein